MKRFCQLFLVLGTLFLMTKTLAQQPPSTNLRASNAANLIVAPIATPVGGGSNGVIYQYDNKDNVLDVQKDLGNPTTVTPILSQSQIEDKLGKKIQYANIDSISPDGKLMYMYVYELNNNTPVPYFASTDLSFMVRLKDFQYPWGRSYQQAWSPDGSALMGPHDMGMVVLRRSKSRLIFNAIQGNMLTWSKDSKQVYTTDSNGRLTVFKLEDGSKTRYKVPFLDEINRPYVRFGPQWERIMDFSFSPASDDTLLLVGNTSESQISIYKTTLDFSKATILTTANVKSKCNPFSYNFVSWSPNGQYVWLLSDGCDSFVINATNGSIVWKKSFFLKSDGQWDEGPCGWSPDNHFVTIKYQLPKGFAIRFWDPLQPDKPVLSMNRIGTCPVWLP